MRTSATILATLATLSGAAVLAFLAAPAFEVEERYQPGEFQAARESITFSLLGQLRMSLGDLMWLKTLEYLHNGIVYRMPTQFERSQGEAGHEFTGLGAGVAHVDGPTLIPERDHDWRGILGTLNRHIEPWREGHAQHSDPRELIPWYQLLVRLNPYYVQAYVNGAFFLSEDAGDPERARTFLQTGAEKNPWSFEIHAALGKLYFERFQAYAAARDVLAQATALAKEEQVYLHRHGNEFDELQRQLLGECYLFLARSHEALGDFEQAIEAADRGLAEVPAYTLLRVEKRIVTRKRKSAPGQ